VIKVNLHHEFVIHSGRRCVNCVAGLEVWLWQHGTRVKQKCRAMRAPIEVSIDLTTQDLLQPTEPSAMVEVDDICRVDPLPFEQSAAANSPAPTEVSANDDTVEIELTAQQMDELLEHPA
jgi:hypothetical protein